MDEYLNKDEEEDNEKDEYSTVNAIDVWFSLKT